MASPWDPPSWPKLEDIRGFCNQHHSTLDDVRESAIVLLRSPDVADRKYAIEILAALKDPVGLPPLLEALKSDPDPAVRIWTCSALKSFDPDPAIERAFGNALNDSDANVRRKVINDLSLNDPAHVDRLRRMIQVEPDPQVRVTAAWALVQRGHKDDAVLDVFRRGLALRKVRAECEGCLEWIDRLELPLPGCDYKAVGLDVYKQHQAEADNRFGFGTITRIEHVVQKGDRIYYELVRSKHTGDPHVPVISNREWYVAGPE